MNKTRICALICAFTLLFSITAYADMEILLPHTISVNFNSMLTADESSKTVDTTDDYTDYMFMFKGIGPNSTLTWVKKDGSNDTCLKISDMKEAGGDSLIFGTRMGGYLASPSKIRYEYDVKFEGNGETPSGNWETASKKINDKTGEPGYVGKDSLTVGASFGFEKSKFYINNVRYNDATNNKASSVEKNTGKYDMGKWYHITYDVDLAADVAKYSIYDADGKYLDGVYVDDVLGSDGTNNTYAVANMRFALCYVSNVNVYLDNISITANRVSVEPVGKNTATWWSNSSELQDFESYESVVIPENVSGAEKCEQDNIAITRGGPNYEYGLSGLKIESGNKYFRGVITGSNAAGMLLHINNNDKKTKVDKPVLFEFDGRISDVTAAGASVQQISTANSKLGMIKWTLADYDAETGTFDLKHAQSLKDTESYDANLKVGQWYHFSALANPTTGVVEYNVYDITGNNVYSKIIDGFEETENNFNTKSFRFNFGWSKMTWDIDNIKVTTGDVLEDENPISFDSTTNTYSVDYNVADTLHKFYNGYGTETIAVILASYNDQGQLLDVDFDDITLTERDFDATGYTNSNIRLSVQGTADTAKVVRYIWNNMDMITPITGKVMYK